MRLFSSLGFQAGVLLLSLSLLSSKPVQATTVTTTAQSNQQIITAAFARWQAGGDQFFNEVLADNVRWTIKGSGPAAKTYQGKAQFLAEAVHPFAQRMQTALVPTVKRIWAEGDEVVVYWEGSAHTKSGQRYHNSYIWIFQFQQQRATQVTAFLDLSAYYAVLNIEL